MNQIVSNLLVYGKLPEDSILWQLSDICMRLKDGSQDRDVLRTRVFGQVKNLLSVSTDYAFDKNLWQNYLTFLLITSENPFSLVCEKVGAQDGTVNIFVKHDLEMFRQLFHYDFSWMEEALSIDCFCHLTHYKAIRKKELMYNRNVSEKVRALSEKLAEAEDAEAFFFHVTGFYRDYGVGMFGLNKAFRIAGNEDGTVRFLPINNMDAVMLDDLIGYELQKKKLVDNTRAFVEGRAANNVLLFGDSGTGKAVIEGGVETKPDNVLIYATSNRRHLIKETSRDRDDMEHGEDMHRSDTMEEKLSLVNRFGLTIYYAKPDKSGFNAMAVELARRAGITPEEMSDEEIGYEANRFEMRGGGLSGRTAQQFVNHLVAVKR